MSTAPTATGQNTGNNVQTPASYSLTPEKLIMLQGLLLLTYMLQSGKKYSAMLIGNERCLEKPLQTLHVAGDVDLGKDNKYSVTEQGAKKVKNFRMRYTEFLKLYDIFSYVNLRDNTEPTDFAFEKFFDYEDEEWERYKGRECWKDVRIAIAEFKGMDVIEIAFMSFIFEGRFDFNDGWEVEMLTGDAFDKVIMACNNNIRLESPNNPASDATISEVEAKNILTKGMDIGFELRKREKELRDEYEAQKAAYKESQAQSQSSTEEDEVEEVVTTTTITSVDVPDSYFALYCDPYYVSPIWGNPYYYDPYWDPYFY